MVSDTNRDALSGYLVALNEANWLDAAHVRVGDEQLPMVGHHQPLALEILAKAYLQPDGQYWEPLGFVGADGSIVAVLGLSHDGRVREVRNLAVDVRHQRRGTGTEVMRAVIEWCRRDGAAMLELTFNSDNAPAARLYGRAGLRPTNEVRRGEPVWSIDLGTVDDGG